MKSNGLALALLGGALLLPATGARADVVLNVTAWVPPAHLLVADITMPFCKDMEAATSGRVKCNLLPKSVVSAPQTLDAVKAMRVSFGARVPIRHGGKRNVGDRPGGVAGPR